MTHPLSAQYPTTEVTLDVTPGTAHGHTLRRTPAAPPSVSPCPLAIARAPPAPLSPTPQGSGQSCCPMSRLFPVVVLKSSATACSSKDFLLSGPLAWDTPLRPKSQPAGARGPSAPSFWLDPWDFPHSVPQPQPLPHNHTQSARPGFPRRGACGQLGRS